MLRLHLIALVVLVACGPSRPPEVAPKPGDPGAEIAALHARILAIYPKTAAPIEVACALEHSCTADGPPRMACTNAAATCEVTCGDAQAICKDAVRSCKLADQGLGGTDTTANEHCQHGVATCQRMCGWCTTCGS